MNTLKLLNLPLLLSIHVYSCYYVVMHLCISLLHPSLVSFTVSLLLVFSLSRPPTQPVKADGPLSYSITK